MTAQPTRRGDVPGSSLRARLLMLLAGTVFGLLCVEVGVRLMPESLLPREFRVMDRAYTGRVKWQEMMVGDDMLGYRYKPDLDVDFPSEGINVDVRTTSHGLGDIGFRDIGTVPPFEAIAIGDSFTFCDDVKTEDCWVKHVGALSGLNIGTLGVSGFSTLAEARVLDRYGRRLAPKLVILAIFPNDFNDNVEFDLWTRSGTGNFWEWRGEREGRGPLFRKLADMSAIMRIVDSALRTRDSRGRFNYAYRKGGVDIVFQPWWLEPMDAERRAHREQGWALMREAILDVRRITREIGAELLVVAIPTKEEVYWDLVHNDLPNREALVIDRPFGPLFDFCAEQSIACCDTTPDLHARANQGEQLYLKISSHWNGLGNRVAAGAVNRCLGETGLLAGVRGGGAAAAQR
jgi:hypothetical protein